MAMFPVVLAGAFSTADINGTGIVSAGDDEVSMVITGLLNSHAQSCLRIDQHGLRSLDMSSNHDER